MNKSVQKILLVVLRKTMPFIKKGKHRRGQHNKSKFYFINDLQKTLDQRKYQDFFFLLVRIRDFPRNFNGNGR